MKKIMLVSLLLLSAISIFANGVCIKNVKEGLFMELLGSNVDVVVENQVAVITTTQKFLNNTPEDFVLYYGFPLPEGASSIGLSWKIKETWYDAEITVTDPENDPSPNPTEMDKNLKTYMGNTSLYFSSEDYTVPSGETIEIKLTYVQLLSYEFGQVDFNYPNDYSLIQTKELLEQQFRFELNSPRIIESFDHNIDESISLHIETYSVTLSYKDEMKPANKDYHLSYSLSLDDLGLFDISTLLNDVPDELGEGFFTFIVEPEPGEENVINKVFTLIVDRSGSMSGDKIVHARNAASFIVNHLNEGDLFNIVDFSAEANSYANEHVQFNESNKATALEYILKINDAGGTNISGAFDVAVPQFSVASENTANIIIFFTDGQATVGITTTNELLDHINQLIEETETNINLFTFGIGGYANEQLLSSLASQNSGLFANLGSNELEEIITAFYLKIQNPVLTDISLTFNPENIVSQTYPKKLNNLYQGSQMIISGRYSEATPVNAILQGKQFGNNITYEYDIALSDTITTKYLFVTKLWAKAKIEDLMINYYMADKDSPEAEAIKQEIIDISLAYGVISPFTNYIDPDDDPDNDDPYIATDDCLTSKATCIYKLHGNYPNPFNPETTISFSINADLNETVLVKIYNCRGQLVKLLAVKVMGMGKYSIVWNGTDDSGKTAASGVYFYTVGFSNAVLSSKMILIK